MLPRQQRGRRDHRDLNTAHRGNKGGAHRHLGLAETHVATDQAIHWRAGGHVVQHRADGGQLVVSFLIREAGRKRVPHAIGRFHDLGAAQHPFGGDPDQLVGHVANALFQPRFLRLPGPTTPGDPAALPHARNG